MNSSELTTKAPKMDLGSTSFAGKVMMWRLLAGLVFVVAAGAYGFSRGAEFGLLLAVAAGFGAYMALNIGANDVANNVGPAVGAKVISLGAALVIAAVFEAFGAIVAGGDVVGTIRSGIIDPKMIADPQIFVWVMLAALLAAALWLNLASALGAPISTTHSIVGGVLGSGVAAAGFGVVNWSVMGSIATSWVVSPLLGGLIAAALLYAIKRLVTYQPDMLKASQRVVPWLVAMMAWVFSTYLMTKGLQRLWPVSFLYASGIGLAVALVVLVLVHTLVRQRADRLSNDKSGVNRLLGIPLVFAAALLSFAHGSNDVANAIGPLAGIVDVLSNGGDVTGKAPIPLWIIILGALGLALGLALWGPKVIRTVGTELTELDAMRAYCIAMAATATVILASQLGLPVSTTHISVGAVFGVGFLREYLKANYQRIEADIEAHHHPDDHQALKHFMTRFHAATLPERSRMLKQLKKSAPNHLANAGMSQRERKQLARTHKKELVKRSWVLRIAAAWVITVPASALLSALVYFTLRGMLLV